MRDWVRHALWWRVYPLGFVGAERAVAGETPVRRWQARAAAPPVGSAG